MELQNTYGAGHDGACIADDDCLNTFTPYLADDGFLCVTHGFHRDDAVSVETARIELVRGQPAEDTNDAGVFGAVAVDDETPDLPRGFTDAIQDALADAGDLGLDEGEQDDQGALLVYVPGKDDGRVAEVVLKRDGGQDD